jgi:hypothetical protein
MLTEHLQRLPDWLLVQNVVLGIWITTVLDTLHVLDGWSVMDQPFKGLMIGTYLPFAPERIT